MRTNCKRPNEMKKRVFAILMVAMLSVAPVTAQIFLDDESLTNRCGEMDELGNIVPFHGVEWDQAEGFAPTGSGILLLTVLGGAYLLGKGRKSEKE